MTRQTELVHLITTCTRTRWFGGRQMQVGDQLPRGGPVPRWFAEACLRHCSPGFRIEIVKG